MKCNQNKVKTQLKQANGMKDAVRENRVELYGRKIVIPQKKISVLFQKFFIKTDILCDKLRALQTVCCY